MLGRPAVNGGFIVGTVIKPKLGLRPQPFANACFDFWLGGDFIKNDKPQGNQIFSPMEDTIRRAADAMKRAQDVTGQAKLFSANITTDDHYEMVARAEFVLETFGENANHMAFLVDGYVTGRAAIHARKYRLCAAENGADAGGKRNPHRHYELGERWKVRRRTS